MIVDKKEQNSLESLVRNNSRWKPVYEDDLAVVFQRTQ